MRNKHRIGSTVSATQARQLVTVFLVISCSMPNISQAKNAGGAGNNPSQTANSVIGAFEAWQTAHRIRDGAIAVSHDGATLATKGVGRRADTPAPVASLSKAITAICMIKTLAKTGNRISLKLGDALPELFNKFRVADLRLQQVTIAQLISHNSGIDSAFPGTYLTSTTDYAVERKVWQFAKIAAHPLASAPGTGYRYSNGNYLILGLVIEALSGKGYEAHCADALLKPLGISNARLSHQWRILSAYGGWELSALDYLKFVNAVFRRNQVLGRAPQEIASKTKIKKGLHYGPGVLMRHTKAGVNFWHAGHWTWRSKSVDDQFGAYFAAYDNGITVSVNYARGASAQAQRALDRALHRAAHQ